MPGRVVAIVRTFAWAAAAGVFGSALLAGVAGCAHRPAPHVWAGQVCTALSPWRAQIAALNAKTQQQLATATTPAQTRDSLVALLGGGETASETARAAVASAQVPD